MGLILSEKGLGPHESLSFLGLWMDLLGQLDWDCKRHLNNYVKTKCRCFDSPFKINLYEELPEWQKVRASENLLIHKICSSIKIYKLFIHKRTMAKTVIINFIRTLEINQRLATTQGVLHKKNGRCSVRTVSFEAFYLSFISPPSPQFHASLENQQSHN